MQKGPLHMMATAVTSNFCHVKSCHVTAYSIHQQEKIVNFFAQDTCNDDIMESLHTHKMAARDSMLASKISYSRLIHTNFSRIFVWIIRAPLYQTFVIFGYISVDDKYTRLPPLFNIYQ